MTRSMPPCPHACSRQKKTSRQGANGSEKTSSERSCCERTLTRSAVSALPRALKVTKTRLPLPGPERTQRNPEQHVQSSQSMARSLHVRRQRLSTDSQVFEVEVLPGTESADHATKEMSERSDHGKNLFRTIRIQLFAMSFIFAGVRRLGEEGGYARTNIVHGGAVIGTDTRL